MKNKFGSLLLDIQQSEQISISNFDILKITNNQTKIVTYENLTSLTAQDFINLFQPETNFSIILLYQLEPGYGHWISIVYDRVYNIFSHWDPYGLYPDHMLNSMYPSRELSRLYDECIARFSSQVEVNTFKFQQVSENINVCGRWAALRVLYWYASNDEFKDYITKTKPNKLINNLDNLVTIMTMLPLDYIQDRNEIIDKQENSDVNTIQLD